MQAVPMINLNDGGKMPQLGLGTYKLKGGDTKAVTNAVKLGYRLIDDAFFYQNQKDVGAAIKAAGVDRKELFITSKVWNTHMSKEKANESLNQTLSDLGTDYVDLLLIHWPSTDKVDKNDGKTLRENRLEVWKAFIEMKSSGKVKHIGVSNFLPKHIEHLIKETGVKPVVNQVLNNPYIVLDDVVEYCKKQDIVVQAWGPLGQSKFKVLQDPLIVQISKKHNKTPAQVVLKWILQNGHSVIPKTSSEERLKENLDVFDFELTSDQVKSIDGLHKNRDDVNLDNIQGMFIE